MMISGKQIKTAKSAGAALLLFFVFMMLMPGRSQANLASGPSWWDENSVGTAPDHHYRVPVTIPAAARIDATIKIDVDFNVLLSQMNISGDFDENSPRIIKSDGTIAQYQQFTDSVYNGITNAADDGQGEIRFILEDDGPVTYYLYFDITENTGKTAWPTSGTINGNFEFGTTGEQAPSRWTASKTDNAFDAQVRPSETPLVDTNGTPVGNGAAPRTTDGTPNTGDFSYLLGSRTNNEPADGSPAVTLTRTIDVPAANPGVLTLRYRVEGWDSSQNGSTDYDYLTIQLAGTTTIELVGPGAGNYVNLPYSPNYGTNAADGTQSGYGQYNGWDTDTNGNHHSGMTLARGSEPWFTVTHDLSAFAGETITLSITSSHVNQYRTWFHIDDFQWSVQNGTLGAPEGFGINITAPNDTATGPASTHNIGDTIGIVVETDAIVNALSFTADIYDEAGGLVTMTPITLYDDGTHGDSMAGDGQWTNNGSVAPDPTYTIPIGATPGANWKIIAYARDNSGNSLGGIYNGLVHNPSQADTAISQTHYFNVDEQEFTVLPPAPNLSTSTKAVMDTDGGDAKPGDTLEFTITLTETGGANATGVTVTDDIPANISGYTIVSMPSGATDNSTGTGTGANSTGYLDISNITVLAGTSQTIVFTVTIDPTAPLGTTIVNTATITNPGGPGAAPSSPPVVVADSSIPASGIKQIYLNTNTDLSRTLPPSSTNVRITRTNSNTWTLSQALEKQLVISGGSGNIPIILVLRKGGTSSSFVTRILDIALTSSDTDFPVIGSLAGQTVSINGTPAAITFSIPISSDVTLDPGSTIALTVTNSTAGTNNSPMRVFTYYNTDFSQIRLNAQTVIDVDLVEFYDAAYPLGTQITQAAPGQTVYVRSVVSDPFGSFDITSAAVDITNPLGTTVVSGAAMTQVADSGLDTKTYEYAYTLPGFGSDGFWNARVTAQEGTEGTVSHSNTGTLNVGSPQLTVVKSAGSANANPGETITYSVQVTNNGTGAALNVVLDDDMSPYSAIRLQYNGSEALPFSLTAGSSGLLLGTPEYSSNNGADYTYTPLLSGGGGAPAGYDANVTNWRIPMSGTMSGSGAGFTLRYQVVVK